jgi:hypothetical protein
MKKFEFLGFLAVLGFEVWEEEDEICVLVFLHQT